MKLLEFKFNVMISQKVKENIATTSHYYFHMNFINYKRSIMIIYT
jgi:hypothetical protein